LFILTTLDAGTRVGRYLFQEVLGGVWRPLGETRRLSANLLASGLMVAGWGFFLVLGVRDPDGGVKALWPLFGIANQMLAAIALCLGTTVLLKMQLQPDRPGRPALVLVTLIPLAWLLAVTLTAGGQKLLHPDPRIGFLSGARACTARIQAAEQTLQTAAPAEAVRPAAEAALRAQRQARFNLQVDAVAVTVYLGFLIAFLALSVREWCLMLLRRRPPTLSETLPVWLPDHALAEPRPWRWAHVLALALGLARELVGEPEPRRETALACQPCKRLGAGEPATMLKETGQDLARGPAGREYARRLEERYRSVRRCC
jgi:carbon starvation protein